MNFAICTYTHTDYKDVWPILFGQLNKFSPATLKKYLIVNSEDDSIDPGHKKVFYNDQLIYKERLIQGLEQIPDDWILYQHEDMILFDNPDWDRLNEYPKVMEVFGYDFIKLIKGGESRDTPFEESDLKIIPNDSNWIFAVQPSIWNRKKLIDFLKSAKGQTIWELESQDQGTCRKLGIRGLYNYTNSEKIGRYHWQPEKYPYIATAIVKGKWNLREYKNELTKMFKYYNYVPSRGHN